MGIIRGTSLSTLDQVLQSDFVSLFSIYEASMATINGTTYLYVPSLNANSLTVFTVSQAGELTFVTALDDTPGTSLLGAINTHVFEVDDEPFLAVTGLFDHGVTVFTLSDSVPFVTVADSVFYDEGPELRLTGASGIATATLSSGTYLYVAGLSDNGISAFSVSSQGGLTNVNNVAETTEEFLQLPQISPTVEFNGDHYFVSTGNDGGLTVFSLDPNTGAMSPETSFDAVGTGTYFPGVPSVKVIGDALYIYVPVSNTDKIDVYAFSNGTIDLVQSIGPDDAIENAFRGQLIENGDTLIYAVSSSFDDSITLFQVNQNTLTDDFGQLSHIQTFTAQDLPGAGLESPLIGKPFIVDGRWLLPVSSISESISILEIGGSDDILTGTQFLDDIVGGGGDDIIHGLAAGDWIDGGLGSDVIYAGSGADLIIVSEGEDVTYGGSGYDTFDASLLAVSDTGIFVDVSFTRVILPNQDRQFVTNVEKIIGTSQSDEISGDHKGNDLRGGLGEDILRGREGNDFLRGSTGNDRILGGEGDDSLNGGGDDDHLDGGTNNDILVGGSGNDSLYGGRGNDTMSGDSGDDNLRGNNGFDDMSGGSGNDNMLGGSEADLMYGGDDSDFLNGEDGDDELNGGAGSDTMLGGTGADVFIFETVASGRGGGFDLLRDFNDDEDKIDLQSYDFVTGAEVQALATQKSWGVRIDLEDGQTIGIESISIGALNGDVFIL